MSSRPGASAPEPRIVLRDIELSWDPASRVAHLRFRRETRATGADAVALVAAMVRWIGTESRPFALLGDGDKLVGVDARYRSTWGAFFRTHREQCHIAFYNMGPIIRVAAELFRLGTGVRLKMFGKETEAREWLRRVGFAT